MAKSKMFHFFDKMEKTVESIKESTEEKIGNIELPIPTTKIAITGLSRSGKTVFITSLIDQLLHQKKIASMTSKHSSFISKLLPPKVSAQRFDYYTYVTTIKNDCKWPKGTDKITSTIIEIESKSRFSILNNTKRRIELIDYPGEWILDISLINKSYEEWSQHTIEWMQKLNEEAVTHYLQKIEKLTGKSQGELIEKELHHEYVTLLHTLKEKHYSYLIPGRFLIPADLADDPILRFAPIYPSSSPLFHQYQKRFNSYVVDVVKSIQLEHFKGFDRQIVLIDTVSALQNGYSCYGDMKKGLKTILSLYSHKNKNFLAQWFSPSIKKILFVATKADLVASSQHNNFLSLLNEMVEELRKKLDISHIITDAKVVASVKCTETVVKKYNDKTLSFVRGWDKNNKLIEIYPGEMPSCFPEHSNWDVEDYAYEEFLPPKKVLKDTEPFSHINMEQVIESLIGDLL